MQTTFREVDIAELQRVLRYEPLTGRLFWKVNLSRRVHAGDEAGCLSKSTGYITVKVFGVQLRANCVAWAIYYGKWPESIIDHRNRCKPDNRIKNLREASQKQNMVNVLRRVGKSGLKGVRQYGSKWQAVSRVDGKQKHLGMFSDPLEAAAAHNRAHRALHGEFALGQP
jgi:HNH endonuclease